MHIFTDLSFEGNEAGIGAVVFDSETGIGRVFGGFFTARLLGKLLPLVGRQIISQVELIAVLSARVLLAPALTRRRVIMDNEIWTLESRRQVGDFHHQGQMHGTVCGTS